MRKFVVLTVALALSAIPALAAGKATVSGVLMDRMCSKDPKVVPARHGKDCAEMADCAQSGYGVVTADGKFHAFDAEGNKKAAAWLKAAKAKNNLKVTVTGSQEGESLKVEKIE